jgi:glycosyltransferase involved in cell wall biosynthesis
MPLRIAIDARHIKDFGYGTYIRNLVRALARLDNDNHYLVTCHPADASELAGLPKNFEVISHVGTDAESFDQIGFPLLLKRLSADLYHIPLNAVPLFMPKPYVVTIHDMSSLLYAEAAGWRHSLWLYRFRRGLLRADRVIAVSGATRRDVESLLRIPSDRIRQIYNSIDEKFGAQVPAEAEKSAVLERYQIQYPYILYAGTTRRQKNIPRLVEAFAVVKGDLDEHPVYRDLRLVIIGDEIAHNPSVRRAVIQSRVEHAVRFLGFVPFETLRIFYEAAAAFVFPSLYEGFGLPPLEAMAAGTPVVTSNVSSLPEVVGDAAAIVNPENVFDIARGIREVLLDTNLRARLVDRGYQRLKAFSWDRTASQVLETYLEVSGRAWRRSSRAEPAQVRPDR